VKEPEEEHFSFITELLNS